MTQQELERAIQEIWTLFKETDRKFKETDEKIERSSLETDRKIQEVNKNGGNLTGKWSRFVDQARAPRVPPGFSCTPGGSPQKIGSLDRLTHPIFKGLAGEDLRDHSHGRDLRARIL